MFIGVVDECRVLDKKVFKRWKAVLYVPGRSTMLSPSNLLDLDFLSELLDEKSDYLIPYNHYRLLTLCADKVVMIYLNLLNDANICGKTIQNDGIEIQQFNIDIEAIHNCFEKACKKKHLENYSDAVLTHLRPLRHAAALLSKSRNSTEFEKTLDTIFKVTMSYYFYCSDSLFFLFFLLDLIV